MYPAGNGNATVMGRSHARADATIGPAVAAGSFIYLPPNVPHAFRITGTTPARFIGLVTPGGLMGLYDEVGIPASERRLPGPDGQPLDEEIMRWNEVSPRYGLSVVGPPIPADG